MNVLKKCKRIATESLLVLHGWKYQTAHLYHTLLTADPNRDWVETRKTMAILPLDSTMDKRFVDLLTVQKLLFSEKVHLTRSVAIVSRRRGKRVFLPLEVSRRACYTVHELLELAAIDGLQLRQSSFALTGRVETLQKVGTMWQRNGQTVTDEQAREWLEKLPYDTMVSLLPEGGIAREIFHMVLLRQDQKTVVADTYWADHTLQDGSRAVFSERVTTRDIDREEPVIGEALALARRILNQYPELPYFHLAVEWAGTNPLVWEIDIGWQLLFSQSAAPTVKEFLSQKQGETRVPSLKQRGHIIQTYLFAWCAKRKGFVDYMYRNWLRGLQEDNRITSTSRREKHWAHRRGFYSYHIAQYGLTEENYRQFLSDYDYKRLRPLNHNYQKWLWDKLFFHDIMGPYQHRLPRYWMRLLPQKGGVQFLPMANCVPMAKSGVGSLLALLEQEKRLVLKPAISSHGDGFYKLAYDAEQGFLVNDAATSREELRQVLLTLDRPYLVSEFVAMHPALQQIYSKVTGTVRVMTIWEGAEPQIMDAYFRIGVDVCGHTDNISRGGLVVPVDVKTGRFDNAEHLINHRFEPCPNHPDTGVPIQGTMSHWVEICRELREICRYLAPMEYLGFDVVVTEDGFRILEINTHQDLHKYAHYPQEVKDYFAWQLAQRRKK